MNLFKNRLTTTTLQHIIFWICIFSYFILSANLKYYYYRSYWQLIETSLFSIALQIITAYTCLYFLMPKFLNKGKTTLFITYTALLLVVIFSCHLLYDEYYYNPKYYYLNKIFTTQYLNDTFWEQLSSISYFISRSIKCFTPTAILLAYQFLKKQQRFHKLNEQKKTAELSALKNQLNPHFLFNTLNNLYVLTIEKSDKAPEIIERLASILDYIIYRCNDTFVPLKKEIELLHNYINLEKVRYGDRVSLQFENHINQDVKIAPLLLLTLIENAFKHGVSQELNTAKITISITLEKNQIIFFITNTKPNANRKNNLKTAAIGLENLKKQLDLIYNGSHNLSINESNKSFTVTLQLKQY